MNRKQRSLKSAAGIVSASLLAATLAFAPTPALAEVGEVTGMDHWYLDGAGDPSGTSVDVLAVTGEQGDQV